MLFGSIFCCLSAAYNTVLFPLKPSTGCKATSKILETKMIKINKRFIIGIALAVLLLGLITPVTATSFSGGSGTEEDPWQIATASDFDNIRNYPDSAFIQVDDVDLGIFTPIPSFGGVYYGNYHTITASISTTGDAGLFLYSSGTLVRIQLVNSAVDGQDFTGGIVSWNAGTVLFCSVYGTGVYGIYYVGGIAGLNDGIIEESYVSSSDILGYQMVGGISGDNFGTIENSYTNPLTLVEGQSFIGGLVGENFGTVENCYSTAEVVGEEEEPPPIILGRVEERINASVRTQVIDTVGGLIGYCAGTLTAGYWDIETSGQSGSAGGEGKTTQQMTYPYDENTYVDWNFVYTWRGYQNVYAGYPFILKNPDTVIEPPFDGEGIESNPYQISNAEELNDIRIAPLAHYIQAVDIDLDVPPWNEGEGWEPIGTDLGSSFQGRYDGNHYRIYGLYINRPDDIHVGMFGYAREATIINLGLKDVEITGRGNVGSLVGLLSNDSHVINCYAAGDINGSANSQNNVGGLIGHSNFSFVRDSYSSGEVEGYNGVGGLIGSVFICPSAWNDIETVENCYSKSEVTGNDGVGGLIGSNFNNSTIKYSYSMGSVTGNSSVGGLIGSNNRPVTNSYWDSQTSGQNTSAGGEARTTDQMTLPYAENTYVNWDFEETWKADIYNLNNGYPYLHGGEESRLLTLVRRKDGGNDRFTSAFEELKKQSVHTGKYGWGISYYTADYHSTGETGPGYIYGDPNDPHHSIPGDRYAHYLSPKSPIGGEKYAAAYEDIRDGTDWTMVMGHIRGGMFGPSDLPNDNPFLFQRGGGPYGQKRTFSFSHCGYISSIPIDAMDTWLQATVASEQWNESFWDQYYEENTDINSKIFFGYLMANIKLHDWDILRGLRGALSTVQMDTGENGCTSWNFTISDGFETFAYRRYNTNHPHDTGASHPLEYRIFGNIAVVMSQLPSSWFLTSTLEDDELIFIPGRGQPQLFKNISSPQEITWVKKPVTPSRQTRVYTRTWDSFPVLDPADTAIETMERGFIHAIHVRDDNDPYNSIHRQTPEYSWTLGDPEIDSFTSDEGYQITHHQDIWGNYGAEISGELCARDIEATLNHDRESWVGYWLANSQPIRRALPGPVRVDIDMVRSRNWFWKNDPASPFYNSYRTMEFGQGYKIDLKDYVNYDIDFSWRNSSKPFTYDPREHWEEVLPDTPDHFSWDEGKDYHAIEVASIDDYSDILEVGIFPDTNLQECIGGAVSDGSPKQILVNPEGYEGDFLEFYFLDNDGIVYPAFDTHTLEVYNFKLVEWEPVYDIIAGNGDYHLIRFTAKGDPPPVITGLKGGANYPNPFNPETTLTFSLRETRDVEIVIYNVRGQRVKTLAEGEYTPGNYSIVWKGRNDNNRPVAGGVYFYRITAGKDSLQGRMLMLK